MPDGAEEEGCYLNLRIHNIIEQARATARAVCCVISSYALPVALFFPGIGVELWITALPQAGAVTIHNSKPNGFIWHFVGVEFGKR